MSSVENFDGPGLSDQPSVIYGFENTASTDGLPEGARKFLKYTATHTTTDDGLEIRELSRSGHGQLGPSPGDVITRDSTKSTLDTGLPELELPGDRGLARDDCDDPFPAFACLDHDDDDDDGCGNQIYVGSTCYNPTCERCWPAAVKSKVVRGAGNLQAFAKILNDRHPEAIDFNHVVASLPSIVFDSDEPIKRALLVIKTLLEEQWGIEGFLPIYHPYRIKQEYRKDQYEHGGAKGQGDMTWKDVLSSANPYQYLTFEPHFHLFFPACRKQFSYGVVPGVYADSGWVFHRITKGGEDCNVSVGSEDEDKDDALEDLVHQLTYCFSHAGVNDWKADRSQLTSRMMGDLKTDVEYVQEQDKDRALAAFCEAAPKLLGVSFTNVNESTCDASVTSEGDDTNDGEGVGEDGDKTEDHPLHDVWNPGSGVTASPSGGGNPWSSGILDAGVPSDTSAGSGTGTTSTALTGTSPSSGDDGDDDGAGTEACGGILRPIQEAEGKLDDDEWVEQAEYADGLKDAYEEWARKVGGSEDVPWADTRDTDGDDDDLVSSGVVLNTD